MRISGTPGTYFTCTYGNLTSQRSAGGTLTNQPTEYSVPFVNDTADGDLLRAACRKEAVYGDLTAQIVYGGDVKDTEKTTDAYGEVNARWTTKEHTPQGIG